MKRSFVLFTFLLSACGDPPPADGPGFGVTATARPAPAPSSSAVAAPPSAVAAPPSAAPSSSAPAPAPSASAAASPCVDGGRADATARFCVKLPEKFLAVSYEELPDRSVNEEVQLPAGPYLRLSRAVAPGMTVAKLREQKTPDDALIVDRGELPAGHWREFGGDGKRTITAEILSGEFVITCTATAPLDQLDGVRAVCRSLTAY